MRVCPRYCGCLLFQTTAPTPNPRPSLCRSLTITGKVWAPLHKHWRPKRENSNTLHNTAQLMPAVITVGGDQRRSDAHSCILMVCPDRARFFLQNLFSFMETHGKKALACWIAPGNKNISKLAYFNSRNNNIKLFYLRFYLLFICFLFFYGQDPQKWVMIIKILKLWTVSFHINSISLLIFSSYNH